MEYWISTKGASGSVAIVLNQCVDTVCTKHMQAG